MNFREELKSKTAAVEKIVESYLPEESGTQHELQCDSRWQASAPAADAGNLSDVRRRRQGSGAVHGSYGDDPHLFSGA